MIDFLISFCKEQNSQVRMHTDDSSSQPFDFSGPIPKHYDEFSGPMFFEPYAIEVSKRIDPSSVRIALELAAGTGRVTRHLRDVLPASTKLVASDISTDMLAVAKEKLKELDIDWQIINAQDLPFEDNSIDLVVCCFGYMFVPDKLKAFAEAYRVLKPGGMLVFSTWDQLESIGASWVYRTIAKEYLNDPLPESYNLPFSMHDETPIRQLLQEAGFSKIVIEKSNKLSISPTAGAAAEGLTKGGVIYNVIMSQNPAWIEEIKTLVEKELTRKFGASPMVAPMSAVISQAWK
jgi:ubiquinone/menaquinone biosynthesis C-methylase UbiE